MDFTELLRGAEVLSQDGNATVRGLEYDSRRIKNGDVFVAIRGGSSDGNRFIDRAIASGAIAVVTDSPEEKQRKGTAWAQVPNGRVALAQLSRDFYGAPADKLGITGITGTNGKSTTAFILEAILAAAGRKSTLVGTIEYHVAGKILPAPHTTPESLDLNRIMSEAVEDGSSEAVMEVSSHALAQQRVFGISFDVAVFTNLTRDHLDYHRTMEEYFSSKQILFRGCGSEPPRVSVLNIDDPQASHLAELSSKVGSEVLTYGLDQGDFRVARLEISSSGTKFDMITPQETLNIFSPLIGGVNVYNILAASAAAHARGCPADALTSGIAALSRVPGRFERVDCRQPFTVVVDYAHTDDALRNLTALAREFVRQAGEQGRVITVFGCGGDRDRSKRPLMGEAAGHGSDFVVLTSDNPRSEDPLAIINDALVGLQRSGAEYVMEPDRNAAINFALKKAAPGDIVLIAGKGHEKVQVTREGSLPFDDVEVARNNLHAAGYACDSASAPVGKLS
ncbi:MAG: UDP-N-acetylmuramoyl-L-alanyl-D-glutamate--2,6-diaminopimelate ligase [Acidobacteriota bacterium]|nr:UDP-N-acetylmuramoyl-L-alanyl-D-glutamate--2,6-diaminopimelate ligase [Acidobacteriota bacterium]